MRVLRLLCLLCLSILTVVQIQLALFEQTKYGSNEHLSSLNRYQTNPYLLSWLAKQKHMFEADLDQAQALYQQALRINSVYVPAWLGLAELRLDQQQKQNANAILDYTSELTDNVKRWRWDKVLVAYQFDRKDILAVDLAYIILEIPGKQRNDALRTAFSVWPDPEELQQQLGADTLEHLFRYTTQTKKVSEGLVLWQAMEQKGVKSEDQKKDTLAFTNMLIGQGELQKATAIWRKHFNPTDLLFNGSFSVPPMQTAFGWRIGKNKGASWYLTEEETKGDPATLHIHFNRKENINLHNILQIVPLQGEKVYALKGKVKTKNLTTDQLPFFEAVGYKCKAPYNKSEMVSADQDWSDLYFVFEVPEECDAMSIRLRRNESTHIDNKLAGDIWLAKFSISETEELFTIFDEEP